MIIEKAQSVDNGLQYESFIHNFHRQRKLHFIFSVLCCVARLSCRSNYSIFHQKYL